MPDTCKYRMMFILWANRMYQSQFVLMEVKVNADTCMYGVMFILQYTIIIQYIYFDAPYVAISYSWAREQGTTSNTKVYKDASLNGI